MPIGPISMILTNVGLQIYNNWCSSRQNDKLRQKREEFERAAFERNTEHMWKLLREGQEMAIELEKQQHSLRLTDLKNEIDNSIKEITHNILIKNWPLCVLPVVMKNQALGTLLANRSENHALHVIFTPSNFRNFNQHVFLHVEHILQEFFNQFWSTIGDHPILFYSGAWKYQYGSPMEGPSEVQIDAMHCELANLPTMIVMPYFRPTDGHLVFKTTIWGADAYSQGKTEKEIEINEIEPRCDEFHFQRVYTNNDNYEKDPELRDNIIEDLVPYLECMIGYMADTYFWSSAGLPPHLPLLLANGTINTDGMNYLLHDSCAYYVRLLKSGFENTKHNPFIQNNLLALYTGSAELLEEDVKKKAIEDVFISYCSSHSINSFQSMDDCVSLENFSKEDLPFIRKFRIIYKYSKYQSEIENIQKTLEALEFDYSIMNTIDVLSLNEQAKNGNGAAMFRLGEIFEYSINIERYDRIKSANYYNDSLRKGFVLADFYALIHDENSETIRHFSDEELYILNYLHSKGVVTASIFLSQYYYYGPEKNKCKVLEYLESAPDTEHPYLYFWAAKVLMDFYGMEEEKSIEYNLKKSANYGYIEAQLLLMNWYQKKGKGDEVYLYAEKAAKQGSIKGISKLGFCLLSGMGTHKDKSKGVELLRLAAQKGDRTALELLNGI